ncbi:unannotated protein [freshwater metagenome]|uniref:Unannotated protein n=1 Tax=freshwater metagenome TaxID=449393 RepID=A0A6J7J096_9ZZZZ|nr:MCE family protein [Actinomycetota bacterium]
MSPARGIVAGLFAVAAVLLAVVLLTGDSTREYRIVFQTAGQLVNDNDVQIGGRRIGAVKDIRLTDDNLAEVTVSVKKPYAPLHRGTTATIRATSISGVANRYVELSPGPTSAPALGDNAIIGEDRTTTIVDLDQIFNSLDEETSKGLQEVIRGFGTWYAGKGAEGNAAAKYFSPALTQTRLLVEQLNADRPALETVLTETSKVVATLASQAPTLTDMVSNANTTLGAIADENRSLAQALDYLPQTLRRGSTTFVNLRNALDDVDKLVAASGPATEDLAPFLAELRPLLETATPTFTDLSRLVRTPGANNDLTELLRTAPSLAAQGSKTFPDSVKALNASLPVLSFIRPYTPDLVGWLRDFGQSTANYDANGHFARVAPVFNAFSYDSGSNTLVPVAPANRKPGLQNGLQYIQRCPGAASQAPADGSAPWRDVSGTLDCDSSIVLPGP